MRAVASRPAPEPARPPLEQPERGIREWISAPPFLTPNASRWTVAVIRIMGRLQRLPDERPNESNRLRLNGGSLLGQRSLPAHGTPSARTRPLGGPGRVPGGEAA